MRELFEKWAIRLVSVIFLITLLLNISISYRQVRKAQDEFMRNSLSFLYNELKFGNDDVLEEFKKDHSNFDIIFFDKNNDIIYKSDPNSSKVNLKIAKSEVAKKVSSNINPFINSSYYISDGNTLLIKSSNKLIDLFEFRILSAYILLYLITIGLIRLISKKMVNSYIRGLEKFSIYYNYNEADSKYKEIIPYFKSLAENNKSIQEELNITRSRLTEIINITENMEEGFIAFDENGNIEIMNQSAKTYLNKDESSNLYNLIDKKEYELSIKELEITLKSKSLSLDINDYNLKVFIDPISDTYKSGFVIMVIDNSENRKAEIMRREFTANVTHELKSPLTSINGYAELISMGIAKQEDIKKFGSIIYKEGNRLLTIIDDILKLSRLDENATQMEKNEVDIYDIINQCIINFENLTKKKKLRIKNKVDHYSLVTSRSLFTDLFTNIYENAIKYSNEFGIIEIDLKEDSKYIKLLIKDNGVGISKKDMPRIFERFYVVDKSRKRDQKSTGLGLSIVKHIADYLNYEIDVKSQINKGSTFIIKIPK